MMVAASFICNWAPENFEHQKMLHIAPVKPSENLTEAGVVASSESLTGDSGASSCRFSPGLSLGRPGDRRS